MADHGFAKLAKRIVSGARPEDAVAVVQAAQAAASAAGRGYVIPSDIAKVVPRRCESA